jgi:PAS domain S-box-containing protein
VENKKNNFKRHVKTLFGFLGSFSAGSGFLSLIAFLQRTIFGRPHVIENFTMPVILGGICGLFVRYWYKSSKLLKNELTERKQVEKTLQESEMNLKRAQRISKMGFWSFNINNKKASWSDESFNIFGIDKIRYPGRIVSESVWLSILENPAETKALSDSLAKKNNHYEFEYRTIPINGKVKTMYSHCEVERDENGNIVRVFGTDHDITERKQLEKQLVLSKEEAEQANLVKSDFLSNISHELRSPMQAIIGFSGYGKEKSETMSREKVSEYFQDILTSSKKLLILINVLLDLSKLESGKMNYIMAKHDFKQILRSVLNEFVSLKTEKASNIEISENNIDARIICDEFKISQVIQNILSNAIKFTPTDKKIYISIHQSELPFGEEQNGHKRVPKLLVKISDQGIGIPFDELDSVFDKFIQSSKTKTGAGGTGLGLAICKEIIEAHHGKIWAENNPEGGATFSFMLPYGQ